MKRLQFAYVALFTAALGLTMGNGLMAQEREVPGQRTAPAGETQEANTNAPAGERPETPARATAEAPAGPTASTPDRPTRPFDPRPLMEQLKADPAKQQGPFTFMAISDREYGVDEFDKLTRQAEQIGFDFIVMPGDLVHRGHGEQGITDYNTLEERSGWLFNKYPAWPGMGNHEISSNKDDLRIAVDRWKAFWGLDTDWYTFTYRNNLFIMIGLIKDLDGERPLDRVEVYPEEGRGMAWLEEQLKAGQGMDNIFVFQHLPLYTIGNHPDRSDHPMVDLCRQYNVTAVIYGHDHYYYRTYRDGITYVISAGGGGGGYQLDKLYNAVPGDVYMGRIRRPDGSRTGFSHLYNPHLQMDKRFDRITYFFPLVTVDGKKVSIETYTIDGEKIDEAVIRDEQGRPVPPATDAAAISPTIAQMTSPASMERPQPAEAQERE